jgi:hypothetical protein
MLLVNQLHLLYKEKLQDYLQRQLHLHHLQKIQDLDHHHFLVEDLLAEYFLYHLLFHLGKLLLLNLQINHLQQDLLLHILHHLHHLLM